jgi:hypothetical protein
VDLKRIKDQHVTEAKTVQVSMLPIKKYPKPDERITMEIIVDANGPVELSLPGGNFGEIRRRIRSSS